MSRLCSLLRLTTVALLLLAVCLVSACAPEPVVQEEFPEPNEWFSVESVEFDDSGVVTVKGEMLAEVADGVPDVLDSQDEPMIEQGDPGLFPEHIAYGFWPDPDEVGAGEAVEVATDGSFIFEYDLSRPEGIRKGWHVLQFDKENWGSQMVWVNVAAREWSETSPPQ